MTISPSWLPLASAAGLGWVPLTIHSSPTPSLSPLLQQNGLDQEDIFASLLTDRVLSINVSGVIFKVFRKTLEKFPNTLLGSDEREFFYDEETREYFFDRDPNVFHYILYYYRTGKLHYLKDECVKNYAEELTFFRISSDYIHDCCYKDYRDRKRGTAEHTIEEKSEEEDDTRIQTIRGKIWYSFENPTTSTTALIIYYVTGFFIAGSVLANITETVGCGTNPGTGETVSCGKKYKTLFFSFDTACVLIFTTDYLLRLFAAPDRVKFMKSIMSIFDICSVLPYYVGLVLDHDNSQLAVIRVFRVFKLGRHSELLRILGSTLHICASELGFLVFSLAITIIIFSTVMYYAEKSTGRNNRFTSIPATFWYTLVTMTTLGYGDIVPKTVAGKIVGGVCALSGLLVIALPLPIIVSYFSRIYNKKELMNKRKTRKKMKQFRTEKMKTASKNAFLRSKRIIEKNFGGLDQVSEFDRKEEGPNSETVITGTGVEDSYTQLQHHHLLRCLESITNRTFVETAKTIMPESQNVEAITSRNVSPTGSPGQSIDRRTIRNRKRLSLTTAQSAVAAALRKICCPTRQGRVRDLTNNDLADLAMT